MTIEVSIEVKDQELREILIATLFDLYFTGIEEKDTMIKCYVAKEDLKEEELNEILRSYSLSYSYSILKEKNWNEIWERDFSPVVVDNFCAIRADFHASITSVVHEIIITPKMSFGTGHHATTYLMIEQMQHLSFERKKVADFGTGTGVLSILSEKMSARAIWAIDNDDWSITNASENLEKNGCGRIQLEKKDRFDTKDKFDIILANINRNVILENLKELYEGLKPQGLLLLSGLLSDDEAIISEAALTYNLAKANSIRKDGWISILLTTLT